MGLTGSRCCLIESPTLTNALSATSQIGRRSEFTSQIQVADFLRRTREGQEYNAN
jgi:hypothetical protein